MIDIVKASRDNYIFIYLYYGRGRLANRKDGSETQDPWKFLVGTVATLQGHGYV